MVDLRCECKITEEGKFILGNRCKENNCKECKTLTEIHPFGDKRLSDFD